MTNLLTIKPLVRDFISENISDKFNAVYWVGERLKIPEKPYCMLTELSDSLTNRTAEFNNNSSINNTNKTIQMHKQCVITVGVFVDGLEDYDTQKDFAYAQINSIRTLFERLDVRKRFIKEFSINSISGIRPLHETVEGGYEYRYEFDLTIGYNEIGTYIIPVGKAVEADITNGNEYIPNADNNITFEIVTDYNKV